MLKEGKPPSKKKEKTPIVYTSEERVVQHSRLQKCWHQVVDDSMLRCHARGTCK